MKKIAIIRFPGSNCDFDAFNFFKKNGHDPFFIFHTETDIAGDVDVVFLPGGFAFGDRDYISATGKYTFNPGVLAGKSNIMTAVKNGVKDKKFLTIGVCNGFQILVHSLLLGGELKENERSSFYCNDSECLLDDDILGLGVSGSQFNVPVAHRYGKYVVNGSKEKPFLFYKENINGSENDIAGVCDLERKIFGLMPHPERSDDSEWFFKLIEKYA